MKKQHDGAISAAEIAAIQAREIDFSDIPELGEDFWANARPMLPDRTQSVTLRVKRSVLDAYKAGGKGYQTRMNAVLESYARAMTRTTSRTKRAGVKSGND